MAMRELSNELPRGFLMAKLTLFPGEGLLDGRRLQGSVSSSARARLASAIQPLASFSALRGQGSRVLLRRSEWAFAIPQRRKQLAIRSLFMA